jgi:hypothetical protein
MSNAHRIYQNSFMSDMEISQFEQMLGRKAFEELAEVYNEIVLKNKDAEAIAELLKMFFSAGYLKGTKDAHDLMR